MKWPVDFLNQTQLLINSEKKHRVVSFEIGLLVIRSVLHYIHLLLINRIQLFHIE